MKNKTPDKILKNKLKHFLCLNETDIITKIQEYNFPELKTLKIKNYVGVVYQSKL